MSRVKVPKRIGSIEFKAILPPYLEDELILLINSWFPNRDYNLGVGMTKTTIIFKDNDKLVYKIPHNGIYIPVCKEFDGTPKIMTFSYFKEDACEKEVLFYYNLPTDNLKKYFLRLDKYEIKNGIRVYAQKKVQVLPESILDSRIEMPWYLKDYGIDIPVFWVQSAIYKHGKESVIELFDFLSQNMDIAKDLCPSNLGVDDCGNPVIVDYSGFYSYYDEQKDED